MGNCKVVVLMGGESSEREVSLRSGNAICKALKTKGYNVEALDVNKNSVVELKRINPDIAYIALHGKYGEDGTMQGLLEIMGIPYTGSDVASSAMCMNKVITKKMLRSEGIPTADYVILRKEKFLDEAKTVSGLIQDIGLPMVIKAATQGSSIGTYIVKYEAEILNAIKNAFDYDREVLVEKFVDGIELTASVVGNENPRVLPLIEITSENEFYDYESKYTPGMCHHIVPARISKTLEDNITRLSEQVYTIMGCRGCARVDFIVDKAENPYVLEINTIPGMTEMSLVPDAARAEGICFEDLVEEILNLAMETE